MKALTYRSPWLLDLEEVPDLHPEGPDDVVVEVAFCGICGTDLGIVCGGYPEAVPGVILGHEATGVVAEVGGAVRAVRPGDRVVIDPTPYCGGCDRCRAGRVHLCRNARRAEGGVTPHGAHAERFRTSSRCVHRVPDHVSLEAAALIEPLSCVLSGLRTIRSPAMVAYTYVVGAGPLGLLYTWALWLSGLLPVVIESSPWRLAFARTCLPPGVCVVPALDDARNGFYGDVKAPLDVVVDTTSTLLGDLYPQMTCGGTLLSLGLRATDRGRDVTCAPGRGLSPAGAVGGAAHGSFAEAMDLVFSGRVPADLLVSHVLPLDAYQDGFTLLGYDLDGAGYAPAQTPSCKVLLAPGGAQG